MIMTKLSLLVAASILHSVVSFAYLSSCGDGQSISTALSYSKKSNSPDSMSDLSSLVQKHQEVPSPFTSLLNNIGSNDFNEWQSSFGRNGLTDFLPQFSSHIYCLAIDYESGYNTTHSVRSNNAIEGNSVHARLPWQFDVYDETSEATTSITSVPVSTSLSKIGKVEDGDFDCILDSGVMNEIIGSLPSTVTWHSRNGPPALLDLVKLMPEAAQKIREFGIYVAITDQTIPDNAKGYLDAMGEIMGMEWLYDLDGLSKEGYHVSVVRKYYTGPVNFDPNSYGDNLLKP